MSVGGVAGAAGISGIGNSSEMNLSTMFAMLQLEMANDKKAQAEGVISDIKKENEILRQARQQLQEARLAKSAESADTSSTPVSPELSSFAAEHGVVLDTGTKVETEALVQARQFLEEAKTLQSKADSKNGDAANPVCSSDTPEMRAFCDKYNIQRPNADKDNRYGGIHANTNEWPTYITNLEAFIATEDAKTTTKIDWDMNIRNLETFIESRGLDTQTKMVQLEDLMGKYNAWTQGASKTISDGNQLLQSIATR
jgi:hypothetical protein